MKSKSVFTRMISLTSAAVLAGFVTFAGVASAHVTVKPAASMTGAWETYTIKVPSEKEIPTTKVTLKVPENLSFKQYQPVPGWKTTTEKNDAGEIAAITWEAESGGIEAGQFQQFVFVGENPAKDSELAWDAYQYYSDGSIVEWTGDEGSDTPHSMTVVSAEATGAAAPADHGHDSAGTAGSGTTGTDSGTPTTGEDAAGSAQPAADSGANAAPAANSGMQTATLILSIVALIAAIGAWVTAARKRSK
ncbi:YcnI family copper-binding membrane protein [Paenibacillus sp. Z6-24]